METGDRDWEEVDEAEAQGAGRDPGGGPVRTGGEGPALEEGAAIPAESMTQWC